METLDPHLASGNSVPQSLQWFLRIQGDCVQVSRLINYSQAEPSPPRGKVVDFTRRSRMRMLRTVHQIDWAVYEKCLFITLTYPDEVPVEDLAKGSQHRYRFFRYLEKHLHEHRSILWRVEWKERQSGSRSGQVWPHLHLLVGGVRFVPHRLIRLWWRTIVQVYGPLCTDVQQVSASEGAALYVSKYGAKNPSLDIRPYHNKPVGFARNWGLTRKRLVPWSRISHLRKLTDEQAAEVRSMASLVYAQYDEDLGGGFTLLGRASADLMRTKCAQWD